MVVVLNCVYILKSTKIGYKLVTKDRSYTNCSAGGWLRLLHVPKTAIKLLRYVSSRMKIESHLKHNSFFCFHICFRGMSPFSFYHTSIAWWQSWIWLKIGSGSIIWGSNTKNRSEKFLTVTIHLISVKIRLFFWVVWKSLDHLF